MKTLMKLVGLIIFLSCFTSVGWAIQYTQLITFTNDGSNVLSGTGVFEWEHAVPDDFSVPSDTVNSATLSIVSKRAESNNDHVYIDGIDLSTLSATGNSQVLTSFDLNGFSVFVSWTLGDPLEISLDYDQTFTTGNETSHTLTMVSSLFSLDYNNVERSIPSENIPSPVPEPSTVLLLGSGLLGLLYISRRKLKK